MERRKQKRFPFTITLKIEDLDELLQVVDLSKTGVGFICEHELPLDFYFNAKITIDDEKHFYTVAKIIRKEQESDTKYHYGCEFVGLADILVNMVDELEN